MATLRVSAYPAEFKQGYMSVKLSLVAAPPYEKTIEIRNLKDVEAAVIEARKASAGTDVHISVHLTRGRKPNGFDAWKAANRPLFNVNQGALNRQQVDAAEALLTQRPAVIPGTRAIVDDAKRKAWFDLVCDRMREHGITTDLQVAQFCDIAGVAD